MVVMFDWVDIMESSLIHLSGKVRESDFLN